MLLTKPQESFGPTDHATLSLLLQHCPEINEFQQLGQHFKQALQLRSVEAFTTWMEQASRSASEPFIDLGPAYAAMKRRFAAAVSSSWSNGQVEGQVHRLKLIKRQMYGRASFQLLRRRILPFQQDRCFANTYRAP